MKENNTEKYWCKYQAKLSKKKEKTHHTPYREDADILEDKIPIKFRNRESNHYKIGSGRYIAEISSAKNGINYQDKNNNWRPIIDAKESDYDLIETQTSTTIQPSSYDVYAAEDDPDSTKGGQDVFTNGDLGGDERRGYCLITFTSISPAAAVNEGDWYAYSYNDYDNGPIPTTLKEPTESWVEATMTWNTGQPSLAVEVIGSGTPTEGAWFTQDLTPQIRKWVQNSSLNYGVAYIYTAIQATKGCRYYSREYAVDASKCPKAVVDYYLQSVRSPRSRAPLLASTYSIWLQTQSRAINDINYLESIQVEQGIPVTTARIPDPDDDWSDYFRDHKWETTRVYALHGGYERKLNSGYVWRCKPIDTEMGNTLEITIAHKAILMTKRMKLAAIANKDASNVLKQLIDDKVTELGTDHYITPTGTVIASFPSDVGVVFDNANALMLTVLGDLSEEWRWWADMGDLPGEDGQEEIHVERLSRRGRMHIFTDENSTRLDIERSYDQKHQKVRVKYSGGTRDLEHGDYDDTDTKTYLEAYVIPDRWLTTAGDADYYGNALNQLNTDDLTTAIYLVSGDLSIEPAISVHVQDSFFDDVMAVRRVVHRFTDSGFTTEVALSNIAE